VLGGIAALLSCTTEPCSCPPSRSHVVVTGRVTQGGVGLSDAQLRFQEQFPEPCPASDGSLQDLDVHPGPNGPRPDDSGNFTAHVYSPFGPGERCLVVSVEAGGSTTRIEQNAPFRIDQEIPDTMHAGLLLGAP
jgi:hypothetical protein